MLNRHLYIIPFLLAVVVPALIPTANTAELTDSDIHINYNVAIVQELIIV